MFVSAFFVIYLNWIVLNTSLLKFFSLQEIHSPETNATVKKLFIAGIKDDVTEDQLKEYFSDFGAVTNVIIVVDKATGKKRGFGFVEFDDYDPVDRACRK